VGGDVDAVADGEPAVAGLLQFPTVGVAATPALSPPTTVAAPATPDLVRTDLVEVDQIAVAGDARAVRVRERELAGRTRQLFGTGLPHVQMRLVKFVTLVEIVPHFEDEAVLGVDDLGLDGPHVLGLGRTERNGYITRRLRTGTVV
jgi:hypothetical protein